MGMNASGQVLAPHSVLSKPDWDKTNMLGYDLLYGETLETSATPQEAWNYWTTTSTTRAGGFNMAVSGKYLTSTAYPSLALVRGDIPKKVLGIKLGRTKLTI